MSLGLLLQRLGWTSLHDFKPGSSENSSAEVNRAWAFWCARATFSPAAAAMQERTALLDVPVGSGEEARMGAETTGPLLSKGDW